MELLVVGGDKRHAALCELARARGWHVMSMGLPGSLPCAGLADAAQEYLKPGVDSRV